jgi:hypothetical protein
MPQAARCLRARVHVDTWSRPGLRGSLNADSEKSVRCQQSPRRYVAREFERRVAFHPLAARPEGTFIACVLAGVPGFQGGRFFLIEGNSSTSFLSAVRLVVVSTFQLPGR